MKKRIISLFTALLLAVSVFCIGSINAYAEGNEVYDYYSQLGEHEISSFTFSLSNGFKYRVSYPSDIKTMGKCPVLLYSNPTGFTYENENKDLFGFVDYIVSRGYIVLCNTDKRCGDGKSMDAGMTKLLALNKKTTSKIYNKLDLDRVVLAGHSQGGLSAVNMADKSKFANAKYYKAIYGASSMCDKSNSGIFGVPTNFKSVTIPALMTAGTSGVMESSTCPLEGLLQFKNDMQGDVYIARKTGVEHTYSMANGFPYMIAWFDFQLYGDTFAAKAFTGDEPELMTNPEWQDFDYAIKKKAPTVTLKRGKRQIAVKWTNGCSAQSYEIKCALNRSFTKSLRKVTVSNPSARSQIIKKLKSGKRYYVRVRTCVKVCGKTYYSNWSKIKYVKVK